MHNEKPNVLVVEDSPSQARLLQGSLRNRGFQIATADSVATAQKALQAQTADLVLLDLNLPDSTGIDTLITLHSRVPNVPIIVLTSLEDESIAVEALKHGAQDYLVKGQADTRTIVHSIRYAMERARVQRAYMESEERFHLLVDGATDYAIFMLDPDGTLVTWNAGAERITGYRAEDIIGKHFSVFYTADDVAAGVPERSLRKAADEGRVEDERWRVRRDGTKFWGNTITTALRDEAGRLRGFSRVARDMTEHKVAEELLREKEVLAQKNALVELLQSVTMAINIAPTIEDVVRTCLEQTCTHTQWELGCAHVAIALAEEELAVKRIWFARDLDPSTPLPDSPDTEFVTFGVGLAGQAWEKGNPVWSTDVADDPVLQDEPKLKALGCKSGFALPVSESGNVTAILQLFSREHHEPDQPFGEVMVNLAKQLEVVMERKRLEEELVRQATELAHSNAELQEFAKIAAHDLQEPLRAVQGFVGLLSKRYKGKLDADADKFIRLIEDATERMVQLIRGVLEHSRIGTQSRAREKTDCSLVLQEVLANLEAAIQESGAQIAAGALPSITADRLLMMQLFQNVISNAIKYRGTEPPSIHIAAERRGRDWLFSVRDNGIGIDPRHAKRIFGMFNRLHGKTEYAGTGIGLAICKKIVEYHGGNIWVESEPGTGSKFFFTFPAEH